MKGFNTAGKTVHAALHRMNSPEMQPLLAFLKETLSDTDIVLRRADSDSVERAQGRAIFLDELLKAVANAAVALENFPK